MENELSEKAPVFLREATGVVRSISSRDALITTIAVTSIGCGAATMFAFVPFLWPGANQALALILVLPFLLVHSALFWMLSSSMPRSGGDYVWTGRILHPALGTSLNLTWVAYDALFMGSFANYIVSYAIYSVFVSTGAITGNFGLIDWAQAIFTNPVWIAVLGTVFLIYSTIIMILGVPSYLKQQLVYWTIGMVGTFVAIALLLGATPAQYAPVLTGL